MGCPQELQAKERRGKVKKEMSAKTAFIINYYNASAADFGNGVGMS